MTRDDWTRVKALFHEALGRPADEREAFLAARCGGDDHLRGQVDGLLGAHDEAGGFLGSPVRVARAEAPGTVIGRYELVELLGEGGFGEVWRAEQREPLRREVALKVIKLGMDTKQVIARFEAERQALAMMDHPNIATVLDAGATDAGRPYFVMELVRGVPITEYCDARELGTAERLALFVPVCRAVQHAHAKGVVHRDLKPSNVLVTRLDGAPVPKVIDFGIAKATGARLTEETLLTSFLQCIGTPAYMSPEQAGRSGEDVDGRSDVYSLGVLLYELLTGTTPFEAGTLRDRAWEEVLRVVREVDPPSPSRRVSTLGARGAEVASRRGEAPAPLARSLRGELDWIVLKSIEKDRTRRYDTAAALADDVQRHLERRPVAAGPPGRLYRTRKLVGRHRARFAAAGALALVGAFVLLLASFMTARAREARQAALMERARAEHVTRFLQEAMAGADPVTAPRTGGVAIREILDQSVLRLDSMGEDARTEARLRLSIAGTYLELGAPAPARPLAEHAAAALEEELGATHPDTLEARLLLARTHAEAGDVDRALSVAAPAIDALAAALGAGHEDVRAAAGRVADWLAAAGRTDEAAAWRRRAARDE